MNSLKSLLIVLFSLSSIACNLHILGKRGPTVTDANGVTRTLFTEIRAQINGEESIIHSGSDKSYICKQLEPNSAGSTNLISDSTYDFRNGDKTLINQKGEHISENYNYYIFKMWCLTGKKDGNQCPSPSPVPPVKPSNICDKIRSEFQILGRECDEFIIGRKFDQQVVTVCDDIISNHKNATVTLNCLKEIANEEYSSKEIAQILSCSQTTDNVAKKISCVRK